MPEIRKIPKYARWYFAVNFLLLLPAIAAFYVAFREFPKPEDGGTPEFSFKSWVAVSVFVISCLIGGILEILRNKRFRYPQCSEVTPLQPVQADRAVRYHCSMCNVVWNTGMKKGGWGA